MATISPEVDGFVSITEIAADVDWEDLRRHLDGVPLASIQFYPGVSGDDVLVVKAKDADGPVIMKAGSANASDDTTKYFNGRPIRFFIDESECTLSTGHVVILDIGG